MSPSSKKKLSFLFLSLALLLLLASLLLHLLIKTGKEPNAMAARAAPRAGNEDFWARVPGKLGGRLRHMFRFFEYRDKNPFEGKVEMGKEVMLTEEISYDNITYSPSSDQVSFRARRKYTLAPNTTFAPFSSPSQGLFEALESLTNPGEVRLGVSAVSFLLRVLGSPRELVLRIFAVDSYEEVTKDRERVVETVLKYLPKKKAEKIAGITEGINSNYTFASLIGYNRWLQLTNKTKEEIDKIDWIKKIFDISYEEIQTFLGKGTFLSRYIDTFNKNLSLLLSLPSPLSNRSLLYLQLLDASVTQRTLGLSSLRDLLRLTDPDTFPFRSPELSLFRPGKVEMGSIMRLFEEKSSKSLLSSQNAALFLILNKTGDSKKAEEIFGVDIKTLNYISDYVFMHLNKIFLYRNFKYNNTEYMVSPEGKALALLLQKSVDLSYGKLARHSGLYDLLLSKLVYHKLVSDSPYYSLYFVSSPDEACAEVMQRALDDGRKALRICGDPRLSFSSERNVIAWMRAYQCVMSGEYGMCDMSLITYLRSIVFITDSELKLIYTDDLLGSLIKSSESELARKYNCSGVCDNALLAKLQFWKSGVTLDPPEPFRKAESVSEWDPEGFPGPVEMEVFRKRAGSEEEISEDTVSELVNLYGEGNEDKRLYSRFNIEEKLSLMLEGKDKEIEKKFKSIKFMINLFLFNNTLITNYRNFSSILSGNYDEDKLFIDFLKSGSFPDNFKPKINKTTGLSLEIGERKDYDYYTITTGNITNISTNYLRSITNLNFFPLFSLSLPLFDLPSSLLLPTLLPQYSLSPLPPLLSDGVGVADAADAGDKVSFLDPISWRPLPFVRKGESKSDGIQCERFDIDKGNISGGINDKSSPYDLAFSPKFEKSLFLINPDSPIISQRLPAQIPSDSFLCVDPLSHMVLSMQVNLVYALHTKKLSRVYDVLKEDKVLPLLVYSREFLVSEENYKKAFEGIEEMNGFKLPVLIVCLSLSIIFLALFVALLRAGSAEITDSDLEDGIENQKLVPSRDPSKVRNEDLREMNDEEGII